MEDNEKWIKYNEQTKYAPPRKMVIMVFEKLDTFKGNAIDLGCGAGNDSIFLLDNGWNVLAVDKNEIGLKNLKERAANIEILNSDFENLKCLPKSDLIISNFSLPFCNPQKFDNLINVIINSLNPNGRFAGNFFGENDSWASSNEMTFCSIEKVKQLFSNMEIEYIEETEYDGTTAAGNLKHWHIIDVIARNAR